MLITTEQVVTCHTEIQNAYSVNLHFGFSGHFESDLSHSALHRATRGRGLLPPPPSGGRRPLPPEIDTVLRPAEWLPPQVKLRHMARFCVTPSALAG